ncbi:hypothetical protein W02_03570 [Nitrospira sp. KM1]|uniref:CARDB domain-containing protein n=1 Tax=Nitrospira sp. KM1 TaxID=1936990 RepID=UPI0013A76ADB|nr:CARDB domain-containing protein [Nitrospira sp. KM1]BCA53217.1 hypothetical protein W02_03570 [Nitrospira sp. KM1]
MNPMLKAAAGAVSAILISACSSVDTPRTDKNTSAQDSTKIVIDQPLYFSGPDGRDVVVQSGTYQLQQASDSELRLVSAAAISPILLSAQTTRSTPDVPKPIAMGTLYESQVYHLILLLPGSTAMETYGSVSGVHSRGGFGAQKGMVVLKADMLAIQPAEPQSLPDLVPTCGRVFCFGGPFGGTTCTLMTGVLNQGTAAAGPSQAKNGGNTQAVPALQPGQLHGLVFGNYYGQPPSTVQVDAANQVVETNEQNNVGQHICH